MNCFVITGPTNHNPLTRLINKQQSVRSKIHLLYHLPASRVSPVKKTKEWMPKMVHDTLGTAQHHPASSGSKSSGIDIQNEQSDDVTVLVPEIEQIGITKIGIMTKLSNF